MHINNLYKDKRILMFKQCYALEKIHGTSANVHFNGKDELRFFSGGSKHSLFVECFDEVKLLTKFKELFNGPVKHRLRVDDLR